MKQQLVEPDHLMLVVYLHHNGTSAFSAMTLDTAIILEQNGPTTFLRLRRPADDELENFTITDMKDEKNGITTSSLNLWMHDFL